MNLSSSHMIWLFESAPLNNPALYHPGNIFQLPSARFLRYGAVIRGRVFYDFDAYIRSTTWRKGPREWLQRVRPASCDVACWSTFGIAIGIRWQRSYTIRVIVSTLLQPQVLDTVIPRGRPKEMAGCRAPEGSPYPTDSACDAAAAGRVPV